MKKFLDVTFAAVAAVVFCAVIVYKGLDVAGVIEAPDRSFLEGRAYAGVPQASVQAVADGSFQDGTEKYLSDHVPGRSTAMLSNAALQRACIVAANVPFGWECYPTYFDSGKIYMPQQDAFSYIPHIWDGRFKQGTESFAASLAAVARAHPDKRFVVYLGQGQRTPAVCPVYGLTSNAATPAKVMKAFDEALGGLDNVSVLADPYESADAYYADYFKTDLHWNVAGAARACNTISAALRKAPFSLEGLHGIDGYRFTGMTSRTGLDLQSESVFAEGNEYGGLRFKAEDGTSRDVADRSDFWNVSNDRKATAFYDKYYDNLPEGTFSAGGEGTGLLISNSYTGALQRPLASLYSRLATSRALHLDKSGELTLSDLLEKSKADDVIFVGTSDGFYTLGERYPRFFEGE